VLREWGCTLARGLECVEGNTASGIVLEDLTVVRSHNDGCATLFGEAVQELGDSQTVLSIEVPCRLVGEDELGTADEGAGDGDTLLLTAREFTWHLVLLIRIILLCYILYREGESEETDFRIR